MNEKIIYAEREEAKYSETGHKIKALYYKILLWWYKRKEY